MEGLRLLDESSRDGGTDSGPAEEEDVLLDT